MDAEIYVSAADVIIENNTLRSTLFGVHLHQTTRTTIRGNQISSKQYPASLHGDGVRLWNSIDKVIVANTISGIRDLVLSHFSNNRIVDNLIRNSRIAMELVISRYNLNTE